jgi:hypothetical protein
LEPSLTQAIARRAQLDVQSVLEGVLMDHHKELNALYALEAIILPSEVLNVSEPAQEDK